MNWSKNLYAFMLGILIVFSGCFGTGTSDGDETDTSGTTVINYYNNTTVDEPEWFSQGGVVDVAWDSNYDNSGDTNLLSSYNMTECTNLGGSMAMHYSIGLGTRPVCDIPLITITTQSGQMLVIHEWTGFSLNTTCDGETFAIDGSTSTNEWRAPGHAMNCTHDIFIDNVYPTDTSFATDSPVLWSVAYSFRAVTVV